MKKLKFRPRAVIFDMDGVIVDSMPYHFLAWYEALRPYGIRVSCFDIYSKEGERWEKTLKFFLKRKRLKFSDRIIKRIFGARRRIFRNKFKKLTFKGAREFLACLDKNGYMLGLVTGTPQKEVREILPKSIERIFDCIVSGDHVKKGKPHPEPYLEAARILGVRPGECVVVENAPFGIEAAKRAGMYCIALTTSLPREYLKEADMVVESLEEISYLMDKSCRLVLAT
ncbi:MAG: HAD family phosphatase [Candidatus Omnitrophica bacterium]|nr:HAD family phosphatase [Candidatus Omnitrophota bacterium]